MVFSKTVSALLLAVCGAVNLTALEITDPTKGQWDKLTVALEEGEKMSKDHIATWLFGVCKNSMTKADDHSDFVQFVAKETGMKGENISAAKLAKYLKKNFQVTEGDFFYIETLCFSDIDYPVFDVPATVAAVVEPVATTVAAVVEPVTE